MKKTIVEWYCDVCQKKKASSELISDRDCDICPECVHKFVSFCLSNPDLLKPVCSTCNGSGKMRWKEWDYDHSKTHVDKCSTCKGTGKVS